MADFSIAVNLTLQHEGGFVDNAADPGGATNMGIRQDDLPNTPIHTLTVAQATTYYLEHYWKQFYAQIQIQAVASKLFDLGVLFGVGTAVKGIQRALHCAEKDVDGIFGQGTLNAVNAAETTLLGDYQNEMLKEALAVVAAKPQTSVFLIGWQRRINS